MDSRRLRKLAQSHIAQLSKNDDQPSCLPENLDIIPPQRSDLLSIIDSIEKPDQPKNSITTHTEILILELYSRDLQRTQDLLSEDDQSHLHELICPQTLPSKEFAEKSPFATDNHPLPSSEPRRLRAFYEVCLRLLRHLYAINHYITHEFLTEIVVTHASFTRRSDPWTTQASYEMGSIRLIKPYLERFHSDVMQLATDLLKEKIKPLFAKSKNPAITAAGRKAISPLPVPIEHSIDESELKPWKCRDVYIVTVFEWALRQLDAAAIEVNWPLIIPPLLVLLDDSSTAWKVRGCSLLNHFLGVIPPKLLERTGLGEVFQSALMPCLLHLPSLTPEDESLQLLSAVYPTLISLINARFSDREQDRARRQKELNAIFRVGILKGYAHAGENVRIAEFLVGRMGDLVDEMGIESCKHLKHILPLLAEILSAPFATAYPPLLLAALRAMETVILVDWPRVGYHRGEILKGLVFCWLRIEDEEKTESKELDEVQSKIKHCVKLVTAVLKRDVDVKSEYRLLVESDSRLEQLLLV